ncbi:MucR family transcriptional regulator [Pararhizobium mangrovi]|uniref:Transcriptional regulator n=1 Tax=Pararhizobium mangrovi TaxID=2590452 RepID=A0A506TX12_9HYPH|nr:MucR family transcriptional regulator [Pararhizobium mangrovi]TPW25846.1 transcriptional regulator [Pararhizobium mangrovi]
MDKNNADAGHQDDLVAELTAEVVSSYVAHNVVPVADLPQLIQGVRVALSQTDAPAAEEAPEVKPTPAVSPKKSVQQDHLVCLECGAKQKTLKRHLMSAHGLTPAEYRERFALSPNYPLVAPSYAEKRSQLAKDAGLGRKTSDRPAAAGRKKSAKS